MTANKYTLSQVNDCIALDKLIKDSKEIVFSLLKKKAMDTLSSAEVLDLVQEQNSLAKSEDKFSKLACTDKIEYKRMVDFGLVETDASIKAEKSIVDSGSSGNKNQYIYIGIASAVLLLGLIIIVKK